MGKNNKDKPRRSTARTVAAGGVILPVARAAKAAIFGGGNGGYAGLIKWRRGGMPMGSALKQTGFAFTRTLSGYNVDPAAAGNRFDAGDAAKSAGLAVAGGVASRTVMRTKPGRTVNKLAVWGQRKLLGMKTAYKL